ncbi:ABC transporter permease subunit [Arcanobacterium haemolyticum]|uniref:Inner-membrane translocator n=1 Tax=Arcanobacterium haemolyticum (strain ATCC 9345 / DSM 20595 / CCM 5947 / CCUG 17215 / LMG 16163 / NBRC 15585 / NCTC 8452 / 11018) TaxID=644284 RepID=D7BND3_ARCHD|nr:galactoside ABC transporter permease [Arcanobacterium haemolyticum]ADH92432.1 inner-membrane translocator [Arcanobacterium haemolyticum DSM 20595]SQH28839.1 Galactoside transport system permease protein mglC [Arcanobacterium haemolyticum]
MTILTYEKEEQLLAPIKDHVGAIQNEIDTLREDGTTKVTRLQHQLRNLKADRTLTKEERANLRKQDEAELAEARRVQSKNRGRITQLVAEAETYLDRTFDKQYFNKVDESVREEKKLAKVEYGKQLDELKREHEQTLRELNKSGGPDLHQEIKDENFVYKNKQYDAKVNMQQKFQAAKDRRHAAISEKYHMIDLLRNSNFTMKQSFAQKLENYRYSFNRRQFLLKNGLYIVIVLIFIALAILAPITKSVDLFTTQNVLNILQQASPRMFLALGVAGLILLTGTDLSIGRMVGMGMVIATVIMHKGPNTGSVFGYAFDFTWMPLSGRIIFALIACIIATTLFTMIAGFFTARFKMHPFVSTMANMLIIFGLVTYATKGVSFGAIEPDIPNMIVPNVSGFPTIILWAVAATVVVWFIWNKTTFGKNLYAVGGNPEAAAVSGISVFKVTMGAFILAGILYGFGSWLEAARMFGSGSAAYGQGWDMDAIAACVVGGVSFTGGIGRISGVVVGVMIFTGLTYSLTILGIDTNLQFVFEGIIILAAVTLDSLKYVQKK